MPYLNESPITVDSTPLPRGFIRGCAALVVGMLAITSPFWIGWLF